MRGDSVLTFPATLPSAATRPIIVYAKRYAEETGLDLREVAVEAHCANTLPLIETVVDAVETFEPTVIRPSLHTYLSRSVFIKTVSALRYAAKAPTNCSRVTRRSNTLLCSRTAWAVICSSNVWA